VATTVPVQVVLYTRVGCHLCEGTHAALEALLAERAEAGRSAPVIVTRDIDADPVLLDAFTDTVPVVEIGDRRLELATSPAKLRRLLEETLDGTTGAAGSAPEAASEGASR
jgi:hypothetical protein